MLRLKNLSERQLETREKFRNPIWLENKHDYLHYLCVTFNDNELFRMWRNKNLTFTSSDFSSDYFYFEVFPFKTLEELISFECKIRRYYKKIERSAAGVPPQS